jgi:hypothetical protein
VQGVRVHRRLILQERDLVMHEGIPVTAPVQTLVDLAARLASPAVERAVNEADKYDLVDPETLRAALDLHRGEPGVVHLRTLLDRRTFRFTATELERWFLPLAAKADCRCP